MKKSNNKFYLFLIAILFGISLNAQQNLKYKDCDLEEKNSTWFKQITNTKSDSTKIELIKFKIASDTIYKKTQLNFKAHDRSLNVETVNSNGSLCGIKILFVLEYKKRKSIKLNLIENPEYKTIIEDFNTSNISIWILNSQQGSALYGESGSSGVIYLRTKNKELGKLINQIIKNKNSL